MQAKDPTQCRFIRAGVELDSFDMLWASLKALQKDGYSGGKEQREEFTRIVFGLINQRR